MHVVVLDLLVVVLEVHVVALEVHVVALEVHVVVLEVHMVVLEVLKVVLEMHLVDFRHTSQDNNRYTTQQMSTTKLALLNLMLMPDLMKEMVMTTTRMYLHWVPANRRQPEVFDFSGRPGVKVEVDGFSPYDFFNLYLSDDLLQIFVDQTTLYAQQYMDSHPNLPIHSRSLKWTPVDLPEMERFLGLCFLMGLIKKNDINSYWSTDPLLKTPIYGQVMSRDRFLLILKFLHLVDNNNKPADADRLFKLEPLLQHMAAKFQQIYVPGQKVSVDESLLLYKGRLHFRQYIPLKRSRFGIKIFLCCEDSGYTYRFRVYQGREEPIRNFDQDLPQDTRAMLKSEKVVIWLIEPLLEEGYEIYMDNFYTSANLFEYLYRRGTLACGTARVNKAPQELRQRDLQRGEVHAMRAGQNAEVIALKWKDKKDVYMMSTLHDETMVQVIY